MGQDNGPVPPRGAPGVPYLLARCEEIEPAPAFGSRASGFRRVELVGRETGSTHTGLALCELGEGFVDQHLHSYEESFFVLEGEPVLYLDGRGVRLRAGACGVVPVGVEHSWRGVGEQPARWVEMCSPHPRGEGEPPDTFFVGGALDGAPGELDLRDPRNRNLFLLSAADMNVDALKQGSRVEAPAVSASMATAALAYSGITVKMLVDHRLGAQMHTTFMVDYQPGGVAHPHDHPFEESYYMLIGEIDVVAAGDRYTLRPGDVFWTAVGCVHAFYETQGGHVRWLETSAPQPPRQNSYRFNRDWDYLAERLDGVEPG